MLDTTVPLMLLAFVGGCLAHDYCKLCSDHTMCKNPTKGFGPQCKSGSRSTLFKSHVTEILDTHNELRSRVASKGEYEGSKGRQLPAANMRKMEWDWELAGIAQTSAQQCTFALDTCRKVDRFDFGQSIYMEIMPSRGARNPDWRNAVKTWYSEVKDFDRKNILSPYRLTPPTSHYAQVVWAESNYVGCGFSEFPHSMGMQSLFICNYGPAGNVDGAEMYKLGKPCSQCPQGTVCQNSLCANLTMPNVDYMGGYYTSLKRDVKPRK